MVQGKGEAPAACHTARSAGREAAGREAEKAAPRPQGSPARQKGRRAAQRAASSPWTALSMPHPSRNALRRQGRAQGRAQGMGGRRHRQRIEDHATSARPGGRADRSACTGIEDAPQPGSGIASRSARGQSQPEASTGQSRAAPASQIATGRTGSGSRIAPPDRGRADARRSTGRRHRQRIEDHATAPDPEAAPTGQLAPGSRTRRSRDRGSPAAAREARASQRPAPARAGPRQHRRSPRQDRQRIEDRATGRSRPGRRELAQIATGRRHRQRIEDHATSARPGGRADRSACTGIENAPQPGSGIASRSARGQSQPEASTGQSRAAPASQIATGRDRQRIEDRATGSRPGRREAQHRQDRRAAAFRMAASSRLPVPQAGRRPDDPQHRQHKAARAADRGRADSLRRSPPAGGTGSGSRIAPPAPDPEAAPTGQLAPGSRTRRSRDRGSPAAAREARASQRPAPARAGQRQHRRSPLAGPAADRGSRHIEAGPTRGAAPAGTDEPQRSAWRHRLGLPVPQAGRRPGRSAAPAAQGRTGRRSKPGHRWHQQLRAFPCPTGLRPPFGQMVEQDRAETPDTPQAGTPRGALGPTPAAPLRRRGLAGEKKEARCTRATSRARGRAGRRESGQTLRRTGPEDSAPNGTAGRKPC